MSALAEQVVRPWKCLQVTLICEAKILGMNLIASEQAIELSCWLVTAQLARPMRERGYRGLWRILFMALFSILGTQFQLRL